jgi:hypothetical protein
MAIRPRGRHRLGGAIVIIPRAPNDHLQRDWSLGPTTCCVYFPISNRAYIARQYSPTAARLAARLATLAETPL